MPNARKTLLTATLALSFAAFAAPAVAQMLAPWFKDSVGLSAEDLDKMKEALRAAAAEKKVGATADWTSSSGRATASSPSQRWFCSCGLRRSG